MAKTKEVSLNQELNKKIETFMGKIDSKMNYQSELFSSEMNFDWVGEIDFCCPYIDNIVRNPRVALIKEEDVVKIEKAKKTSVATVKNLSRNTHYIDKIDEKTDEVTPSKLLIERYEETFNTYENRYIYTLIENISRFVMKKEKMLDDLKIRDDKSLEYAATTVTSKEKINIELKISANDLSKGLDDNLENEIAEARKKIQRIKEFIASWRKTEFFTSLEKANVPFVIPPIKKTNLILKNPNFQFANKLWDFLQNYNDDPESNDNLNTDGDKILKGILDDAFLMNYYVMDAISLSRKDQKSKLTEYAVVMIHQQIERVISLLSDSGVEVSDQEILNMILKEFRNKKTKKSFGTGDVKDKFRDEFEEYLDQIKDV